MTADYDTIGLNYAALRQPDGRIAAAIHAALGESRSVLNVGAGTGSYEPAGRMVTAVEPSVAMIAQRPASQATVLQCAAENLPFEDNAFDAAMAILTVHHWTDQAQGMAEVRRVTRGPIVILTFDPDFRDLWLFDYFPELAALDRKRMPPMHAWTEWLGRVEISTVHVPHDCTDGFLAACWRRPEAYLEPRVRAAISSFRKIADPAPGLDRLQRDLGDGTWHRRYGNLLGDEARDCGYRLVTAR